MIHAVACPEDAHEGLWVRADLCSHWSMDCPRSKKKKKARHKFKRGERGYLVAVNGLACSDDLLPDYVEGKLTIEQVMANDPHLLDLSIKRFTGRWTHSQGDVDDGYFYPQGSVWKPAAEGMLVECANGCGLKGAMKE